MWPDEQPKEKVAKGEEEAGPATGWFIAKVDIGRWIFDNLIVGDEGSSGKCWSLTS